MRGRGKCLWELLSILSKADPDVFYLKTEKEKEVNKKINTTNYFTQDLDIDMSQCLYCGVDYKGERSLNLHYKSCEKKEKVILELKKF